MVTDKQQIAFRAQPEIYEKFKVVAKNNSRSISQQLEYLMKQCVEKYESENGKIASFVQNNNKVNRKFVANNTAINMQGA